MPGSLVLSAHGDLASPGDGRLVAHVVAVVDHHQAVEQFRSHAPAQYAHVRLN